MADVIRDVVIRLSLQQIEAKVKAPDVSQVLKAEDTVARSREQHHRQEQRRQATVSRETKRMADEHERAVNQQIAQQQRLAAAQGQTANRLKEAGEGAFIMARGLALTFTGTEEGLQKMLKNVAQVQGMFDIYKGGLKIVQQLGPAMALGMGSAVAVLGTLVKLWGDFTRAQAASLDMGAVRWATYTENARSAAAAVARHEAMVKGETDLVGVYQRYGLASEARGVLEQQVGRARSRESYQTAAGQNLIQQSIGRRAGLERQAGVGRAGAYGQTLSEVETSLQSINDATVSRLEAERRLLQFNRDEADKTLEELKAALSKAPEGTGAVQKLKTDIAIAQAKRAQDVAELTELVKELNKERDATAEAIKLIRINEINRNVQN